MALLDQHSLGYLNAALDSHRHALDIRLKPFGEEHVSTADSYDNLGITQPSLGNSLAANDVTKIQTTKLSILPRFYFHDVLEQLKTNFHTNFRFKRVLGFVIEYA